MPNRRTAKSFDIVPWNPSFDTGIDVIDEQHHRLVALLNDLAGQYVHGVEPGGAERIVDALVDYAAYHFETEEAIWAEALAGDPWFEGHCHSHHSFVDKVRTMQAGLGESNTQNVLNDLLSFLTSWLAHHILYEDKRLSVVLLGTRQGLAAEIAKAQALDAMSGHASGLIQSVLSMYKQLSSRTLSLERESVARQKAEQALRDQQERWETVFGSGNDILWDWDLTEIDLNHPDSWLASVEALIQECQRIASEDWPDLRENLAEHILGQRGAFSHQHRLVDTQGRIHWVQARGKITEFDVQGRPLRMVGTQTDITERKIAELRLQRERDTRLIISEFAADFMASSLGDFDSAINRALQRAGEYMGADRTYVFLITEDGHYMNNTHEWCSPGTSPEIQNLQGIPSDTTPWWWQKLRDPGYVLVPRVSEMPPEAHVEHAILEAQGIQSVCVYPLRMGNKLAGFLGNDAVSSERHWGPEVLEFLGLMSDLLSIALDHRQLHQKRAEALSRLERAEQQVHIGRWSLDLASGEEVWSAEVFRICEQSPESFAPTYESYLKLVHPDDRNPLLDAFHKASAELGHLHAEHRLLLADGQVKHVEVRGQFDTGMDGHAALVEGTVQDISERARHQDELKRLAFEDPLTRLPNRRAAEDKLQHEMTDCLRQDQCLALALVDLDNFREANERYGSAVGDQLLQALSQRMRALFDQPGLVARIGGDEFVVLFVHRDHSEDYFPQVKQLLAAINEPLTVDGINFAVSASIGVTEFPQPTEISGDQLFRQAQQALFQAKLEGKNRFHLYDPSWEQNSLALAERLDEIQQALHAGEFVLYYQPKVDMRTGTVFGAEALLRWLKPSGSLIPPAHFLPTVQDHPLEIEIGDWVIRTALAQMQVWQAQGLHLQVSVNVSGQQLLEDCFAQKLRSALEDFPDVAPSAFQLEVLESSALQDMGKVSRTMQECKGLGVSFALDDFGTGFSSLAYLKHLPADVLKIDQGFIRNMLMNTDDLPIVAGIVSMAHAFGLQVIAEGVETVQHGELLLKLGCEQAQGYGIARPMPADELPEWVAAWPGEESWRGLSPIDGHKVTLLAAEIDHRNWVAGLANWLATGEGMHSELDHHRCRLGQWLDREAGNKLVWSAEFAQLTRQHRQLHNRARDLMVSQARGDADETEQLLAELKKDSERLLERLARLIS